MSKILAVITCAVTLAGCMSSGTRVDTTQMQQFQKGVTTEDQVVAKLGEPNSRSIKSDGTRAITYTHIAARPDAVDFVPIVGMFAGGAKSEMDIVIFNFDGTGVLKDYSATTSNAHVSTGLVN
jgi:outer membrane protein assembly factor BamE (lipoprotein component of BamABCDE complex)